MSKANVIKIGMFETVFYMVSPFDIKVVDPEVKKIWPILKLVTIIYLFRKDGQMCWSMSCIIYNKKVYPYDTSSI